MADYDFSRLNDKEFEALAVDILSLRESVQFERFKPGRDKGVDGRFFSPNGREWILQCKHWTSTPIEQLFRYLKTSEAPKVRRLNPERYFLVITHPLSRNDKERLCELFTPYIKNPVDIIGKEGLVDIISANPDLERRHYKLWLSSASVLSHMLNKAIYDRSEAVLQEAIDSSCRYVVTDSHIKASKKLSDLHVVIITGVAGIGKTSLASHLALDLYFSDYEILAISEDISEAEKAFDDSKKQLFYFDDFLGRNYLEALSGHEGSKIVQFIKRIKRAPNKKFVLTSRSTILNQGKVLIDAFSHSNLERNEFEITIDSLTDMDRARILYNHVWHSNLSAEFVDELYKEKRYKKVVFHKNYNPRLVQFITDSERLHDIGADQYWSHACSLLNNPADVWDNAYTAQLDDFGRSIVLLVALNGRAIAESELSEAYQRFLQAPGNASLMGRRDFLSNLRHLSGSLLTRTIFPATNATRLNLFNPSIGDYVAGRIGHDPATIETAMLSLRTSSSLSNLIDMAENKIIDNSFANQVSKRITNAAHISKYVGYTSEYIARAHLAVRKTSANKIEVDEVLASAAIFVATSECPTSFYETANFLLLCRSNDILGDAETREFILAALAVRPTTEELELLSALQDSLPNSDDLVPSLVTAAHYYFMESVHEEFLDEDVFDGLGPEDSFSADLRLRNLIEGKFENLGLPCSDMEIDQIVDAFDIGDRMREYFRYEPDAEYFRPSANADKSDEIDDLFDRSR